MAYHMSIVQLHKSKLNTMWILFGMIQSAASGAACSGPEDLAVESAGLPASVSQHVFEVQGPKSGAHCRGEQTLCAGVR